MVIIAIGPDWATGSDGTKSLDDEGDWIRIETIKALSRDDLRVVPVLLDGAPFPDPLGRRNRNAPALLGGR